MSVFSGSDSRRLSNFLQTHIFWKLNHISRTYNQSNYSNIWFTKVTIFLIMVAQVLFLPIFFEKDPHLNAVKNRFAVDWCRTNDFNLNKYIFTCTCKGLCTRCKCVKKEVSCLPLCSCACIASQENIVG